MKAEIMHLDRRAALRLLALGTAPAVTTVRADGDLYANHRIGLSLRKPKGWFFVSLADHWVASVEHRRSLNAEAQHLLDSPETVPILVIGKNPPGVDGFNPSITVYDEAADASDNSALELLVHASRGFPHFAADAFFPDAPGPIDIKGCQSAARCAWSYSHPLDLGEAMRVGVVTIMVLRNSRVQTIHFFLPEQCSA
ncbi:hypothetical protein, partial [Sphaerotilus sp.]|uniref:hypothetical protein n=1 Tax=Sphaerotilus sp. TaxID=2093942 RepID=UPI00286D8A3E